MAEKNNKNNSNNSNNSNEKLLQEKYVEFQMLERQMKQVQVQIEQIEAQISEIIVLKKGLQEIKDVKTGKELFVPIGAGIFVNAELKSNQDVLVNVGSGVVVKKSIDEAGALLEHQARELRNVEEERAQKLAEMSQTAGILEQQLSKLMGEENV